MHFFTDTSQLLTWQPQFLTWQLQNSLDPLQILLVIFALRQVWMHYATCHQSASSHTGKFTNAESSRDLPVSLNLDSQGRENHESVNICF